MRHFRQIPSLWRAGGDVSAGKGQWSVTLDAESHSSPDPGGCDAHGTLEWRTQIVPQMGWWDRSLQPVLGLWTKASAYPRIHLRASSTASVHVQVKAEVKRGHRSKRFKVKQTDNTHFVHFKNEINETSPPIFTNIETIMQIQSSWGQYCPMDELTFDL